MIAALFASATVTADLAAGEIPFSDPPAILSGGSFNVRGVITVDMDGDGDLDVASAADNDDRIAWHENGGEGNPWTLHTVSTSGESPESVFAADFDGDGDPDLVTAHFLNNEVLWHENTSGDGSTWTTHTISTSVNNVRSVFAADFDGDGDADVLSEASNFATLYWHENDGSGGSPWTRHTISNNIGYAYAVFAADIDGDGDMDALVADRYDALFWFANDGDGATWTQHTITTTADSAVSLFVADFDGDGDLDALSGSYLDDKVAWYENDGNGGGWSIHTITAGSDQIADVYAADLDSDGDIDVISDSGSATFAWYENDGSGGTWTAHTPINDIGLNFVAASDLDGDGDIDLTVAAGNDTIDWYRNDTIHRSASFSPKRVISTAGNFSSSANGVDIDSDGDQDVLSSAFGSDTVHWHENNGSAGGWTLHTITDSADAYSTVAADLDGDGDIDVAAPSSSGDGKINWFENNGNGTSWTTHTIISMSDGARQLASADIDRDGDMDIASVSRDIDTVAWFENDGIGLNWTKHDITTNSNGVFSIFAGDIDRDGDMDIVSGSLFTDSVVWHENDGSGAGWSIHTITVTTDGLRSVWVGDMDVDGDMDVVTASSSDNEVEWYENDSQGGTWTQHQIYSLSDTPDRAEAWDIDNDGDLDVLVASNGDNTIAWHENLGGGINWSFHEITTKASFADWASAGDLDGDGDLDALSASTDDDTIAWYENRGGQFALPTLNIAQKIVNNASTHDLLDIQAIHRGRTGDSDAELVTLELKFTDDGGVDLTSAEANNIIDELRIHLDDGSGAFEPGTDNTVATITTLNLTAGVQTIGFSDGNPNAQLPFGSDKIYFVVADITADADSQAPAAFQVGHVTESTSTGEDRSADIPLTLEFWPNTGTGVVDTALSTASCQAPFDLALSNRTVTTTVACQAGTFIRAGDAFVVGSGGDLSLSAGETIRFTSGFYVDTGTLTVTIDPALTP